MNPPIEVNRLEELAQIVAGKVPRLIGEATDSINEAINAAVENAQEAEGDKEAVLSLPIAVKWNLDTNKVEVALAVNVKHKFTSCGEMVDPNQPELLDRDGDPLPPSVAKPLRKVRSAIAKGGATVGEIEREGGEG